MCEPKVDREITSKRRREEERKREKEKKRKNRWWLHPTPPVYAHETRVCKGGIAKPLKQFTVMSRAQDFYLYFSAYHTTALDYFIPF
jgi:hypothetical protein